MVVMIDGKKYSLVPVEESTNDKPTSRSPVEMTNDLLAIPTPRAPKARRMGGARVSGLPRCLSSQRFIDMIQEQNEEKKKKEEEKKKRQEERERKCVAKQQAKAMVTLKRRHKSKKTVKKVDESSSDEAEGIEYADDSDDDMTR